MDEMGFSSWASSGNNLEKIILKCFDLLGREALDKFEMS
jgi:hypothetical protein